VPTDLPNLHDSILNSIHLDWESGDLRAQIQRDHFDITVVAQSLISLDCPRHKPWDPSIYINSAVLDDGERAQTLTIEMQSGDLIRIEAKHVSLAKTTHNEQ
jgi:hypothetical protein